jgi:NAD+ synthetase
MKNYPRAIGNIRNELRGYAETHRLQALVLGISGGIDSALCAALAEPVCRELDIPLIGRSIPIETNKPDEIERARLVGKAFCTDFLELDLGPAFRALAPMVVTGYDAQAADRPTKVRQGNLKARLRMIALYDLAARYQGLVLSTDNFTEYLLGFWTLHGDHADYGMIQNLWKTEVYEMANCLVAQYRQADDAERAHALQRNIDAVPTDGLGISASDCEQFGVETYAEVDAVLKAWLQAGGTREGMDHLKANPVIRRHEATHFKRQWPVCIRREALEIGGVV